MNKVTGKEFRRQLRWMLAGVLALWACSASSTSSLFGYQLRSLEAPVTDSLDAYRGKPVIMLFFQPECSWCLKQVRAVNRLPADCRASFNALAIGVNGDRKALKQELRRLRPDFPAYQANPALLDAIGGVPATPFALLGDANGEFHNWMRGYIPQSRLVDSLAELGADC